MEHLLTNLTASLTELREPSKVLARAGNRPVAILNRNEAIGYFVPKSAVTSADIKVASAEEVNAALNTHLAEIGHVLDYLKDK
jgi:antitoxin StbD